MRQRRIVALVQLYGYQQPLFPLQPFGDVLEIQVAPAFAYGVGRAENRLPGEELAVSGQVRSDATDRKMFAARQFFTASA